jgi:hypothetical protein
MREVARSEICHQNPDAEMEMDSSIEEKVAVVLEWFEPERAIFSSIGEI